MRISDWSSDVCSSDLPAHRPVGVGQQRGDAARRARSQAELAQRQVADVLRVEAVDILARVDAVDQAGCVGDARQWQLHEDAVHGRVGVQAIDQGQQLGLAGAVGEVMVESMDTRSEEHTSELQSLMRLSYAVFCLKKKTQ